MLVEPGLVPLANPINLLIGRLFVAVDHRARHQDILVRTEDQTFDKVYVLVGRTEQPINIAAERVDSLVGCIVQPNVPRGQTRPD